MPSFLVASAICITKWQHVTEKKKVYHVALDNWNFLQHKGLYIWKEKVNVEGCHWSPMQVRPRKSRLKPNPQRTSSIACSSLLQEFFPPASTLRTPLPFEQEASPVYWLWYCDICTVGLASSCNGTWWATGESCDPLSVRAHCSEPQPRHIFTKCTYILLKNIFIVNDISLLAADS